jgi:hypothetical protein
VQNVYWKSLPVSFTKVSLESALNVEEEIF